MNAIADGLRSDYAETQAEIARLHEKCRSLILSTLDEHNRAVNKYQRGVGN